MSAPWASLPELPLLHVGAFLAPRDLTRAARVCSAWRSVMLSDALWRPLCAWQWLATEGQEAGRSYHEWYGALHRQYGRFRNYRAMKYVETIAVSPLLARHLALRRFLSSVVRVTCSLFSSALCTVLDRLYLFTSCRTLRCASSSALCRSAWLRIERWLAQHAPAIHASLQPGAALDALATEPTLTPDHALLLHFHNGQSRRFPLGVFGAYSFYDHFASFWLCDLNRVTELRKSLVKVWPPLTSYILCRAPQYCLAGHRQHT